jgi:hypothetical protein
VDDLDPYFTVYEWHPRLSLAALRARMERGAVSRSPEAAMSRAEQPQKGGLSDLELPVNFGDVLLFAGYELLTPTLVPGGAIELVTLWEVTNPALFQLEDLSDLAGEPVLFVHALDTSGALVAQEDRLDAPAWDWQKRDVIAQIHRIALPRDLKRSAVMLRVGVYRQADVTRLPVLVGDDAVSDSVILSPVHITG